MSEYETICILEPDLPQAKLDKINEKIQKVVTETKSNILVKKDWGKRKLAFRMRKFFFGQYLYFNFEGEGNFVADLEKTLKYDEDIMRFLTVKLPKVSEKSKMKFKKVSDPEEMKFVFDEPKPFSRDFSRGPREDFRSAAPQGDSNAEKD